MYLFTDLCTHAYVRVICAYVSAICAFVRVRALGDLYINIQTQLFGGVTVTNKANGISEASLNFSCDRLCSLGTNGIRKGMKHLIPDFRYIT